MKYSVCLLTDFAVVAALAAAHTAIPGADAASLEVQVQFTLGVRGLPQY